MTQETASQNEFDPEVVSATSRYSSMVLLVDDQPIIGEAVRRMLADEPDINFHFCADPVEAIAVAERIGPTVILQDLVMPNMSGLDVLKAYGEDPLTRNIPVVVLSTKEEPTVKSHAFAAGASDYLVKLPDRIELIARIRLHSRARINQLQRDAAYRALRESQQRLIATNAELLTVNQQLADATEALRIEATHDSLSGLLNRRAFFESLKREVARWRSCPAPLAVIMADVDHFKSINDQHGHMAGDIVIREVSRRMRNALRLSDVVGRYGGEEFVVLAPGCPMTDALDLAERFRTSVCTAPITIADGIVSATMSLGVAATTELPNGEALLKAADEALYRAKRGGRNKVELQLV